MMVALREQLLDLLMAEALVELMEGLKDFERAEY